MPPCNCHPPFPRPEPFSPLPRPGHVPDWGKWIRDRLAEKGALLAFPTASVFPDPGAQPNVYEALDTGTLYRWDGAHYQVLVDPSAANDVLEYEDRGRFPETGEHGKLYIDANTGSLYRWGGGDYVELPEGKADKAVPQAAGNLAALTRDGNLVDSGTKPSDFADAANTYTIEQTNEAIDKLAAYYITADAQGNPFATHAALVNAQTYYSGGAVRTPTRNDYAVVSADETHGGAEWRYIYAVDAQGVGQWEPQYAVEGVVAYDDAVTRTSANGVKSSGIWSMLWGALSALPTGFSSLYDWCVAQLAGKVPNTRKVNGRALSSDVTLTGANIAVSGTDARKISAVLAGKATKADATLTPIYGGNGEKYSAWSFSDGETHTVQGPFQSESRGYWFYNMDNAWSQNGYFDTEAEALTATSIPFRIDDAPDIIATRTANPLLGYQLGPDAQSNPNRDKPLASEAEAEALRTGKVPTSRLVNGKALTSDVTIDYIEHDNAVIYGDRRYVVEATTEPRWMVFGKNSERFSVQSAEYTNTGPGGVPGWRFSIRDWLVDKNISSFIRGGEKDVSFTFDILSGTTISISKVVQPRSVGTLALTAPNPTAGNLAALTAQGNPTDSLIPAANVALKGNIPYDLGTPIVINAASSEVVEGETVNYGAATLANRTANIVQVTAATALDELRITFPAATSGKVRDFGLRVEIGTGSAALTAPALVPIAPTGETIKIENNAKEIPALADGTVTAKGVTLLYFSENAPGVFVVNGEQVEEVE